MHHHLRRTLRPMVHGRVQCAVGVMLLVLTTAQTAAAADGAGASPTEDAWQYQGRDYLEGFADLYSQGDRAVVALREFRVVRKEHKQAAVDPAWWAAPFKRLRDPEGQTLQLDQTQLIILARGKAPVFVTLPGLMSSRQDGLWVGTLRFNGETFAAAQQDPKVRSSDNGKYVGDEGARFYVRNNGWKETRLWDGVRVPLWGATLETKVQGTNVPLEKARHPQPYLMRISGVPGKVNVLEIRRQLGTRDITQEEFEKCRRENWAVTSESAFTGVVIPL